MGFHEINFEKIIENIRLFAVITDHFETKEETKKIQKNKIKYMHSEFPS